MNRNSISKEKTKQNIKPIISLSLINFFIFLSSFLQIIGETKQNGLLMSLKPLPIILMVIKSLYFVKCDKLISYALIFSLLGDILLMAKNFTFFKIGTVCFLIAHINYIRSFIRDYQIAIRVPQKKRFFAGLSSFFVLSFLILNNYILWQTLPDKLLFPIYGIILSSMVMTSFYRFKEENLKYYFFCLFGAALFMFSDSLIAHSKLGSFNFDLSGAFIMGSYYLGQYLILKGASRDEIIKIQNF